MKTVLWKIFYNSKVKKKVPIHCQELDDFYKSHDGPLEGMEKSAEQAVTQLFPSCSSGVFMERETQSGNHRISIGQ